MGKYSKGGVSTCLKCRQGTYTDKTGSGACTECGPYEDTASDGSTSKDDCECDRGFTRGDDDECEQQPEEVEMLLNPDFADDTLLLETFMETTLKHADEATGTEEEPKLEQTKLDTGFDLYQSYPKRGWSEHDSSPNSALNTAVGTVVQAMWVCGSDKLHGVEESAQRCAFEVCLFYILCYDLIRGHAVKSRSSISKWYAQNSPV